MRKKILAISALSFATLFMHQSACAKIKVGDEAEIKKSVQDFPLNQKPINRTGTGFVHSYAPVLEAAQNAVVAVHTEKVVRVMNSNSQFNPLEEMLRRYYGIPSPRNQQPSRRSNKSEEQSVPAGLGSGVIVSKDGYILTNNHVVRDENGELADKVIVKLSDDVEYDAEIIGTDANSDVAVLKVEAENLPAINLANSDNLMVGDVVFAIGNPLGVGKTVTMGIVSATNRNLKEFAEIPYQDFIQTDASINQGNSGGALVDSEGRLIGINTAILSRSGGNIGIGFAIPVNMARNNMISLINTGTVQRGFLGIYYSDLTQDMAEASNVKDTNGALVEQVQEDSPADKAGITPGDIIIQVDDKKIKNGADLRLNVSQISPGTEVLVHLYRDGELMKLSTTLGDRDDPNGLGAMAQGEILEGIFAENLDPELREQYQIEDRVHGVLVTEVEQDSPYIRGFRHGTVITEINKEPVRNIRQARKLLKKGINRLYVYYRGSFKFIAIRID